MATVTDSSKSVESPDPTRHVWQVPTFLIGAAVFVSAWQGWLPLGTPDPGGDFGRDIAALRVCSEKVNPDRDELKDALGRVAANVDAFPAEAPLARFALGSGYARLAELTADPTDASAHWALARSHFELVKPEQLKDTNDGPKLAFRKAKARAAGGFPVGTPTADIRQFINQLGTPPFGEEPGEAGRLQAALALKLSPPDIATAKIALDRYLQSNGVATPAASLARAKLTLGDIYIRSDDPAAAKKWLEQIGIDAPLEVVIQAKASLARVRMIDQDWLAAARDWEALRAMANVPQSLRAGSAYHLAVCKANSPNRDMEAAVKLYEEAIKGDGAEAIAASVRLAEHYLKNGDATKKAATPDLLATATKGIKEPKQFRNPFIRVNEVQDIFELAISVLTADGVYESAVRCADDYAALSAAGREREKRAETLAAWALSLQKSNGDFKPKAAQAAAEYEALEGLQPAVPWKADVLRRAAGMHRLADEPGKAVEVLQKAIALPKLPDAVAGPVWADLADALIAAKRPDEVWPAFNNAMLSAGPVSTATRYRLARQFADTRNPGFVNLSRALWEQIAKQETVSQLEQEFHELALVELAHEFIRLNNYPEAESWLRKQLGFYPTGPEAARGRLLLGVCLLQKANTPLPAAPDAATATRLREEALKLFKSVVGEADAKLTRDKKLSERDAWLRLQSGLRVLQAYQQLQKPNDLLVEAKDMLTRHRGTIEELIVLSLMYHAFRQKKETGLALETRDQMKELFDRLPATAFPAQSGEYSRTYWETVWFVPDKK